jgi:hypothetical protein
VLTHTTLVTDETISPELVSGQSIIVFQTESGRQILHVDATPVARAGQNFDLSPDGMSLAVIRTDAIEIYSLPPLTGKEREAVKLAEAAAPKAEGAPISSALLVSSPGDSTDNIAAPEPKAPAAADSTPNSPAGSAQPPSTAGSTPASSSNGPAAASPASTTSGGDGADEEQRPRKPPTLYNEPGEHAGTNTSNQTTPR